MTSSSQRDSANEIIRLQRRIDTMLKRRASFGSIEDMIDAVEGLTKDQKAALWLYSWSHQPRAMMRREAVATLQMVATD